MYFFLNTRNQLGTQLTTVHWRLRLHLRFLSLNICAFLALHRTNEIGRVWIGRCSHNLSSITLNNHITRINFTLIKQTNFGLKFRCWPCKWVGVNDQSLSSGGGHHQWPRGDGFPQLEDDLSHGGLRVQSSGEHLKLNGYASSWNTEEIPIYWLQ